MSAQGAALGPAGAGIRERIREEISLPRAAPWAFIESALRAWNTGQLALRRYSTRIGKW